MSLKALKDRTGEIKHRRKSRNSLLQEIKYREIKKKKIFLCVYIYEYI